jgi:hypothetical protein
MLQQCFGFATVLVAGREKMQHKGKVFYNPADTSGSDQSFSFLEMFGLKCASMDTQ